MTTRQGLADSYLASGRAKEAVSAYKRVVADRDHTVGPDHLDTVRARYSLGGAYQRTGKTVAAERIYEQAQAGFERVLGPLHPDTLRSRAELARVYRKLGRYGDARALLSATVDRLARRPPPWGADRGFISRTDRKFLQQGGGAGTIVEKLRSGSAEAQACG